MPNSSRSAGKSTKKKQRPAQTQVRQPGRQHKMSPAPQSMRPGYRGSEKLAGRVALITGGDSGIGRAVAVAFAAEGADIAIVYYEEGPDAQETARLVADQRRECLLIRGDLAKPAFCAQAVKRTAAKFKRLDIVVNNAAVQFPQKSITDITPAQLQRTFAVNIFAMFHITAAAMPHLESSGRGCVINTTSVTAYRGSSQLLDYSSTKGAIVSFTRSLSAALAEKNIRVNAVAPGPIWTPLIPATFPALKVSKFGSDVPLGRAGQPWECAGCYVLLASDDGSYITGQVLHPNGGEIVNG